MNVCERKKERKRERERERERVDGGGGAHPRDLVVVSSQLLHHPPQPPLLLPLPLVDQKLQRRLYAKGSITRPGELREQWGDAGMETDR